MNNILLISELKHDMKLKNLFVLSNQDELREALSKYYGFKDMNLIEGTLDDSLGENSLNVRGILRTILADEIAEEFELSMANGGRFNLYKISGTQIFINPVNGSELENYAEFVIVTERLNVFQCKEEEVKNSEVTKLDAF